MKSSVALGLFSTGQSAAPAMVAAFCEIGGLTVPALPFDRSCCLSLAVAAKVGAHFLEQL
jgi:hypothetical protein